MKISVIIPTLNEEKHIGNILSDLSGQTITPDQVIVVDGKSEDRTWDIVSSYEFVTSISSQRGVGHQRRIGAEFAKGDLLVFLDADTRIDKDFLEQVAGYFYSRHCDIACPRYRPITDKFSIKVIYGMFNTLFYLFQGISPSGAGMCIAVTKEHYQDSGGIDPRLTYEDIEFIRRSARKGAFSLLPVEIYVSDRRFQKHGVIQMTAKYSLLSVFFFLGMFRAANRIDYEFGHYDRN
jgi:glycosyltransferase involved in cell wall biosynthesis